MEKQNHRIEKDAVIGIKLPRALRDKFTEATMKSDVSQSQLLRSWIRNYIAEYEEREKRAA